MDTELFDVCLDGSPIISALSRRQAEIEAQFMQRGFDTRKAGDRQRTGELSVRPARCLVTQEQLYHAHKTHTTVVRP